MVGEKPRGYRFPDPYYSFPELKEVPVNITSKLFKRLARYNSDMKIDTTVKEKYPYLAKWFNSKLTLDF